MQFSLNYVWIQAVRLPIPEDGVRLDFDIPKKFINNITNIAEYYCDAPINVWVDIYGIGNHSDRIMNALNAEVGVPNITFKALDSIPSYRTHPLFKKKHTCFSNPHSPIWQQADLARLYVLEHCLTHEKEDAAIYSDMDRLLVPRFRWGKTYVENRDLNQFSFFQATGDWALHNVRRYGGAVLLNYGSQLISENGFIGFQKKQKSFLENSLIPLSKETIIQDGRNGWYGHLRAYAPKNLRRHDMSLSQIALSIPSIDPKSRIKRSYQKPLYGTFLPA